MIFNQLFLKETILIIKCATLQAGLRGIIFQFIHSFPFTNTFGLRGSVASQGTAQCCPKAILGSVWV